MISGMFGNLPLATVQISDLRKQQNKSINQPVKSRQSQIFLPNTFNIEIQRPNFNSIQLNHPLLSMDLNDILNTQFFESNSHRFGELIKKNQQYLNEYQIKQDYKIASENRIDQKQIAQMTAPIKNNKQNMVNHNESYRRTTITSFQEANLMQEYQKQDNSCYPFINPYSNQDSKKQNIQNSTTQEKSLNEILNIFKQNNYEVNTQTLQFYIDAYKTKDPNKLLELYKADKSR